MTEAVRQESMGWVNSTRCQDAVRQKQDSNDLSPRSFEQVSSSGGPTGEEHPGRRNRMGKEVAVRNQKGPGGERDQVEVVEDKGQALIRPYDGCVGSIVDPQIHLFKS